MIGRVRLFAIARHADGLADRLQFAIDAGDAGDCEPIPPGADGACIPPASAHLLDGEASPIPQRNWRPSRLAQVQCPMANRGRSGGFGA